MRTAMVFAVLTGMVMARLSAADDTDRVWKAVEKSTLDQPGTKPFHLKAVIVPVRVDAPDAKEKTGTVEIWWVSPTTWRREINSPQFSQVEIVDGGKDWQKDDGDFFPEWLRESAVALVRPVPDMEHVLERVKSAEVRQPIPATSDGWFDAEWGVKHEAVDGVNALRVSRGPENPDGTINGEAYWIGDDGRLLKVRTQGLDVQFENFEEFGSRLIARLILVRKGEKLVMRVKVTSVTAPGGGDPAMFAVKGHEWTRQFTQELR